MSYQEVTVLLKEDLIMLTALLAEMRIHNPTVWDCVQQDILSILNYEKAMTAKTEDELSLTQLVES